MRRPSEYLDGTDKPLNVYEGQIVAFLNDLCYRDPQLADADGQGWAVGKHVRDTGPYAAHRNEDNDWVGEYRGFHSPVLIWYSPEMIDWLRTYRPAGATATLTDAPPVPDGAIIVKEMYTAPASRCRAVDVANLSPTEIGVAYMVRDSEASWDG